MIGLLQRVSQAKVAVGGATVGQIGPGLLVLLAVEPDDTAADAEKLVDRVLRYRVFEDPAGRMNLSLLDTGGGLLLVFNAFWLKQVRSDIETMKGELEVNRKARLALEKEIHDLRKK